MVQLIRMAFKTVTQLLLTCKPEEVADKILGFYNHFCFQYSMDLEKDSF